METWNADRFDTRIVHELPAADQCEAWVLLAGRFLDDLDEDTAQPVRSCLQEALRLDSDDFDAWAARAELESSSFGEEQAAIQAYRRLDELDAGNERVRAELAILLVEAGETEEGLALVETLEDMDNLEQAAHLGEVLFGAECLEAAVEWLDRLRDRLELELRSMSGAGDWHGMNALYQTVWDLHGEAFAELYGRDRVVVESAAAGKLDARSGVNFVLLGQSLMEESDLRPVSVNLRSADEEERQGKALKKDSGGAQAHLLLGSAALRKGHPAAAQKCFRKAMALHKGYWPALCGLGAAMEVQKHREHQLIDGLAELPMPDALEQVVPDWPSLAAPERRVVLASVHPLRRFLPGLAEAEAVMRLLPVDVRVTDLPEFCDDQGELTDDHRTLDALGGVADDRVAVARILELPMLAGPLAWTFAHELAHLVFENHRSALKSEIQRLFVKARGVGWLMDAYGAKNDHEFLAVTYQDYLRHRYELPLEKELDEEGVLEEVFDWFDGLSGWTDADV